MRSPYTEYAGLPNTTHLEGGVRSVQAQDQQVTTRIPKIVTACLLASSMLIKRYVHVHDIFSRFRAEAIMSFRIIYLCIYLFCFKSDLRQKFSYIFFISVKGARSSSQTT